MLRSLVSCFNHLVCSQFDWIFCSEPFRLQMSTIISPIPFDRSTSASDRPQVRLTCRICMSQKSLIFWELGSLLQLAIFIFFGVVSSVIVISQYSTRLHVSHPEFSQQLLVNSHLITTNVVSRPSFNGKCLILGSAMFQRKHDLRKPFSSL